MSISRREIRIALLSLVAMTLVMSLVPAAGSDLAHAMTSDAGRKTRSVCPLTGETATARATRRPSVAVRISNSPEARPQVGIGKADLVIETLTEGGTTRFIAVFHCSGTTTAGPVRSARLDDPAIVAPFSGLFGFSGANAIVLKELEASDLINVTEVTAGTEIYRSPADSTDVNSLRADIPGLRALATAAGQTKPGSVLRFGDAQRSTRTSVVDLGFGSTSVGYRWRSGSWTRSQDGVTFRDATGSAVKTANVLVQEVEANASKSLFDSAGSPSPKFDLVGSGRAFLFRDRKVIKGTWTDAGPGAPVFRTTKGAVMKLARGRTWLEMVPGSLGDLKGTISYR